MGVKHIMVADPIPLFRDGLCRLIIRNVVHAQVLEADDVDALMASASRTAPALIVLGLSACGRDAYAAISRLRERYVESAILVIGSSVRQAHSKTLVAHGADRCVPRTAKPEIIEGAISALLHGRCCAIESPPKPSSDVSDLTPRQRQILQQLALGRTNKEIAVALGISHYTVRVHISSLFRLLGVKSRTAAVAVASGLRL